MTLILTVGNASGVYQSSDYQLTDLQTGKPVSDSAGSKQLEAIFKSFNVGLAFTGIASTGPSPAHRRTIDSLSAELQALPHDSQIQDVCAALAKRSVGVTTPHGSRGLLALVLTFAALGKPFRVGVISNFDWRKHPPEAKPLFNVAFSTITKPFHLISGYRGCVPADQRYRLRALARNNGKSPSEMLETLAEINAIAAKGSKGYVSEGCWVTSQVGVGPVRRSASRNIGSHLGDIPLIQSGFNMSDFIRQNIRAIPGKPISLVQRATAIFGPGGGTPLPPPTGPPLAFTLTGSSAAMSLRSPAGDPCATVEIAQLECCIETRVNEEVTGPFATVALAGVSPMGGPFSKPLFPWPQLSPALMIDDAAVPRGWEYSIIYWIENNAHHVIIPQSSRSIRNVGFLGPEDEMVFVAPSTTMEFAWGEQEQAPSATIDARVCWRSRVNGTRG